MFGIDDAITAGLKIIDKFVPDPAAKAQAEADLRQSLLNYDAAQTATNTAEASNSSVFVAGWRPWIGWVCGAALAYQYVGMPLIMWGSASFGHPLPVPPIKLDDNLWQLLLGMLGMGGLRTYEKLKGVASTH